MPRKSLPPLQLLKSRSRKMKSGCIEWIGPRSYLNYGVFSSGVMGRMGAHRASWILHNGPIPVGMSVLHRCNNPPCVNPDHLKLGDHHENMKDRKVNGNYPQGENHFAALVSSEDAIKIFNDKRTCRIIAESYGLNRDVVQAIRQGKTYVDVTGGGCSRFQKHKGDGKFLLSFQGRTLPISEWSKEKGLKYGTIYFRLRKKWPMDQVLMPLTRKRNK